jgi:hypothetical protein
LFFIFDARKSSLETCSRTERVEKERLCRAEKINSDGVSLFDDEGTGDNKAKLRVVAMFCKSVNKHSFFVLSFVARKQAQEAWEEESCR